MSKRPNKKAPPSWIDDEAVYELVQSEMGQIALEEERQFYLLPWETYPGVPADEVTDEIEQSALEAWRRKNPNPLTDLLHPEHPLNKHGWFGRPIREQLSAEAWSLIRERLLHKPRKRGGKQPVKRGGRPKMTAEERRENNPVHDAAAKVPAIEAILRQNYPDQAKEDVVDRAYAFAGMLMGIDDAGNKVRNYLNRSKKDRARLP